MISLTTFSSDWNSFNLELLFKIKGCHIYRSTNLKRRIDENLLFRSEFLQTLMKFDMFTLLIIPETLRGKPRGAIFTVVGAFLVQVLARIECRTTERRINFDQRTIFRNRQLMNLNQAFDNIFLIQIEGRNMGNHLPTIERKNVSHPQCPYVVVFSALCCCHGDPCWRWIDEIRPKIVHIEQRGWTDIDINDEIVIEGRPFGSSFVE